MQIVSIDSVVLDVFLRSQHWHPKLWVESIMRLLIRITQAKMKPLHEIDRNLA